MDVIMYIEYMCMDMSTLESDLNRLIPEKAESLGNEFGCRQNREVCWKCKGEYPVQYVTTEYLNFSYYDGGVDIVETCEVCYLGIWHGMPKWNIRTGTIYIL